MEKPFIHGKPPELDEKICEELICQQYCYRGRIIDEANAVYLRFAGQWHMLYFDCGTIFWAEDEDGPMTVEATEEGYSCPLIDLGEEYGLKGKVVVSCEGRRIPGGAEVELSFENGTRLIFRNENGINSYVV